MRTVSSTDIRKVYGGNGAYTQGLIKLTKGTTLYIYVGGKASDDTKTGQPGWNGGGEKKDTYTQSLSGGGATDIRLEKDETSTDGWSDFDSLKSRIMVAAGGGGSAIAEQSYNRNFGNGGDGGKLEGLESSNAGSEAKTHYGTGGTQTTAGYAINNANEALGGFGYGGDASTIYYGGQSAGGGGGYYGGGGGYYCAPGGGGSSFISGYEGCDAITKSSTKDNITHTGQSVHYSGMKFINGVMKAGNESMPDYNGSTMTGNRSNGYARITYVEQSESQNFGYTGDIQTFTALQEGTYKLETWGAQGGGSKTYTDGKYTASRQGFNDDMTYVEGGKGGYTTSTVYLKEGQTIYIVVGGKGEEFYSLQGDNKSDVTIENGKGFNGGEKTTASDYQGDFYVGGGGGATHITLTKQGDGQLSNYENNKDDVLVVAGGGGGSGFYHHKGQSFWQHGLGGAGGGLESQGNRDADGGYWKAVYVSGSTQTSSGILISGNSNLFRKGSFGQGNSCLNGGGGGWYGGTAASCEGAAGGSGHIGTGLTGETIAGTEEIPSPYGTTETGHQGNGYARITFVK